MKLGGEEVGRIWEDLGERETSQSVVSNRQTNNKTSLCARYVAQWVTVLAVQVLGPEFEHPEPT